jgi:hypothetical protein
LRLFNLKLLSPHAVAHFPIPTLIHTSLLHQSLHPCFTVGMSCGNLIIIKGGALAHSDVPSFLIVRYGKK